MQTASSYSCMYARQWSGLSARAAFTDSIICSPKSGISDHSSLRPNRPAAAAVFVAVQLFRYQGECCIIYNNYLDSTTAKQVIENHFKLSNVPL